MRIRDLQQQQAEWVKRQPFANAPAWQPHLGMIEEVGELAHAHLKEAQGIRGTAAEHQAAAKDAVGDIVIYAADYCTRSGVDLLEECPHRRVGAETFDDLQRGWTPVDGTADIFIRAASIYAGVGCRSVGDLMQALACYCTARGWSLDECVTETWNKVVSKRDWSANPQTGEA